MICLGCGEKLKIGSKFCEYCGHKISLESRIRIHQEKSRIEGPTPVTQNAVDKKWLIVFGISGLILIGIIIAIASFDTLQESSIPSPSSATPIENVGKFYTKSDVNVRSCGSTSCEIIGRYPINTEFNLQYKDIVSLPEWIGISWVDARTHENKYGYISKLVISSTPIILETEGPTTNPGENDYATIIAKWQNRVARVTCLWNYSDGTFYEQKQGSAILVSIIGHGVSAITNKHVVTDNTETYAPSSCTIGIYGVGARVVNFVSPGNPFFIPLENRDWAYIYLDNSAQTSDNGAFDTAVSRHLDICDSANLGDKVVVLGYPTIGTSRGITATEGIVSGVEDEFYVTSAKIDYGNSGGAAILVKGDCYLGIPTLANSGGFESLGRILKSSFVIGK